MVYKSNCNGLLVFLLVCSQHAWTQLAPFFFGTYVDQNEQSGFFIYTMDEVAEDCFLVEFQRLENGHSIEQVNGYGHCHGPNGHMEIKLSDRLEMLEVWFDTLPTGERRLTFFTPGFSPNTFLAISETERRDVIPERRSSAERFYKSDDGRSLVIHASAFEDEWSYVLYAPECEKGGVIGGMLPIPSADSSKDEKRFVSKLSEVCALYFTFYKENLEVEEVNCPDSIKPNCPRWKGSYTLE